MKWKNTLMSYEDDIKNRGFWDWIKAHTSFMKPLHRYNGTLELNKETITFTGEDIKKNKTINLKIQTKDITDIHLGFDNIFKILEDRAVIWNKPLRIRYNSKDGEKTIYLFANFHYTHGMRSSNNSDVYKELKLSKQE